ncbi:hypothetical protein K7X08_009677 [Anisodus acutangulus]|uniref:Uncharacterized protein n=1 Tax=Anisodus acutangulus TaxID=402998 RepID=A0A9Q1N474_9SOLA|nr:hypothetical protein K7X08_009677 [Anisodus acutangulus]
MLLKIEMGSWTTVENNQTCMKQKIPIRSHKQIEAFQQERERRVTIESDEDIVAGFSCWLEENGTVLKIVLEKGKNPIIDSLPTR